MKKLTIMVVAIIFVILAGCQSNKLKVEVSTPKTFTPGKAYSIQIKVVDDKGEPVKGAKIKATLNMKDMDHGTMPLSVSQMGNGKYIGLSNLAMDGKWIIDIDVDHNGEKSTVEKEFSVKAASMVNAHKVTNHVELPDFTLIDENGKPVTKKDLLGKKVALTFTYVNCTDPNACPVLLANFSKLQQDLKSKNINTDHIELISVSVDPERDTPEVLKKHAQEMGMDLSYLKMLTGKPTEIKKLADSLGEKYVKEGSSIGHDNKTFIFDSNGTLTHEFIGSYINQVELFQVMTAK
ncbi:MAG: FixH family protein [Bacillota bacterium]|nr:FixH family protein [Bacillota bacterium]